MFPFPPPFVVYAAAGCVVVVVIVLHLVALVTCFKKWRGNSKPRVCSNASNSNTGQKEVRKRWIGDQQNSKVSSQCHGRPQNVFLNSSPQCRGHHIKRGFPNLENSNISLYFKFVVESVISSELSSVKWWWGFKYWCIIINGTLHLHYFLCLHSVEYGAKWVLR